MSPIGNKAQPIIWLVLYWASQWVLSALVILLTREIVSQPTGYVVFSIGAFAYGWLVMLPLWAASYLALGRVVWWRRPMAAIALGLSLEVLTLLGRGSLPGHEYRGDLSLMHWLPFLSAAVVWSAMAFLGRWQMVRAGEPTPSAQFALRDLFIWTAIVAAAIWPVQGMVVAIARDSRQMLDKLLIALAAIAALFLVPPITMIAASLIRIRLGEGRPSRAILATLLLPSAGLLGWGLYVWLFNSPGGFEPVIWCTAFTAGAVSHTLLLGQLLRRLGYRIRSRSWWARR